MANAESVVAFFGYQWSLSSLVSLGSAIVAVTAFALAIVQYRSTKAWERKRYVAAECEQFFCDPVCRAAFSLLDYSRKRICLYPDHPNQAKRFVIVDCVMVAIALIPHDYHGRPPMRAADAAIRDIFDVFFGRLDLIYQFHKAGLIKIDDLAHPLGYLGQLLAGRKHMNPKVNRNLKVYLRYYDYEGVIELFEDLGHAVRASDAEIEALKKRCKNRYWENWVAKRAEGDETTNERGQTLSGDRVSEALP